MSYRTHMRPKRSGVERRKRRGTAIILAMFLMTILVGMLAFSIDIGFMAASKAEMRRTADAAALAGAWELLDRNMANASSESTTAAVRLAACQASNRNAICNVAPNLQTEGSTQDIQIGYIPSLTAASNLTQSASDPFRAVRVVVRKHGEFNGKVPFFFARIFGETGREMTVEATAALATQIRGFSDLSATQDDHLDILPFALDLQTWNAMQAGAGQDNFRFNAATGLVQAGCDGIREVNLYPQGTGSPGNRGTVDIGSANNSTADIARQILEGISHQDLVDLGKPLLLPENGALTLNGDTGISAGVKDELASIKGKVRIIPIFSSVTGNGNNATYAIVRWASVRILDVRLTGSMKSKQVIVQPAPTITRHVIPGDASRTWSQGLYSRVTLVH